MTTQDIEVFDALGDPVAIGKCYGYSTSKSGWSYTTIGIARKSTPKGKVTISDKIVTTYLYGKKHENVFYYGRGEFSSVTSHHLFPVTEEQYNRAMAQSEKKL